MRGLVYLAILFPYLLALLSTYVSIQLIRGQSLSGGHENHDPTLAFAAYAGGPERSSAKSRSNGATMFWLFYRNTKVCMLLGTMRRSCMAISKIQCSASTVI